VFQNIIRLDSLTDLASVNGADCADTTVRGYCGVATHVDGATYGRGAPPLADVLRRKLRGLTKLQNGNRFRLSFGYHFSSQAAAFIQFTPVGTEESIYSPTASLAKAASRSVGSTVTAGPTRNPRRCCPRSAGRVRQVPLAAQARIANLRTGVLR